VKVIGVLLLLFVALVGLMFIAGGPDAPEFDLSADYSFDLEPAAAIAADVEQLAEWVPAKHRCVLRGRVTVNRYDQCEPMPTRALALASESERLILPRSIRPATNRYRNTQSGRFAGDRA
jgi:hypothetical protein